MWSPGSVLLICADCNPGQPRIKQQKRQQAMQCSNTLLVFISCCSKDFCLLSMDRNIHCLAPGLVLLTQLRVGYITAVQISPFLSSRLIALSLLSKTGLGGVLSLWMEIRRFPFTDSSIDFENGEQLKHNVY